VIWHKGREIKMSKIVGRGTGDWSVKYRPCRFEEIHGNERIVTMLKNFIKNSTLPHTLLFTGPAGCGKTTAARILAMALNCSNRIQREDSEPCCRCESCKAILNFNSFAVTEVDAGRTGDVATTRKILDDLPAASMGGEPYKVVIFDEAHNLTGQSKSEEALLKFLEKPPDHVYTMLCTNQPEKFKTVTLSRCKTIQFGRLSVDLLCKLVEGVATWEGVDTRPENVKSMIKYVAEEANGAPRASLTYLQMIASEGSWTKEAASLIINSGVDVDSVEVYDFSKILIKGSWLDIKAAYEKIKTLPAESIRIAILGFLVGCIKNAKTYEQAELYAKMADTMSYIYYGPKPEHVLFTKLCQALRYRKAA
jgi:DNA polymerase-3 subunit gamma/tau